MDVCWKCQCLRSTKSIQILLCQNQERFVNIVSTDGRTATDEYHNTTTCVPVGIKRKEKLLINSKQFSPIYIYIYIFCKRNIFFSTCHLYSMTIYHYIFKFTQTYHAFTKSNTLYFCTCPYTTIMIWYTKCHYTDMSQELSRHVNHTGCMDTKLLLDKVQNMVNLHSLLMKYT